MTFTGVLESWNDERGFGFISPKHGGPKLFIHISALPKDGSRPTAGETLTYELGRGTNGQPQALKAYRNAFGPTTTTVAAKPSGMKRASPRSSSVFSKLVLLALLIALGAYSYNKFQRKTSLYTESSPSQPVFTQPEKLINPAASVKSYTCDGRTHCSQMTSCTEATYFLKNCPGTTMDGNNDGIPCEQQWCTGPLAK
jgi:cold shock CspA family protein